MVKCPYCGKPAMTLGRKAGLGPGRVVPCRSCSKGVAAHWVAVFAALPAFLGGLAFMKSESLLPGLASIAAGLVAMALLQTFLVPLVKTDG